MCVCIYINVGHFGGLSNKNMTKRQRECGICFFLSTGTPQDFILCVGLAVKSISLGVGTWNLRLSILLIIVSNLCFMSKEEVKRLEEGFIQAAEK